MKDFSDIVKEKLSELYEEEDEEIQGPQEEPSEDEPEKAEEPGTEDGGDEEEADFHADSFDDFLTKTETTVTVKKEGCLPSPIFGNRDSKNHNKYRVTLKNPKGSISFVFWDSIRNTETGKTFERDDAIACFANDISAYESNPSFEGFKSEFGYDETDGDLAQKAFNGCRKQMEKAKRIFEPGQLDELMRLGSEY